MPRPASFDRAAAVETAKEALWSDGFEASSVKALSERLGITRSSFYNAFGSREDLFKAALSAYGRQSPDHALYGDMPEGSLLLFLTAMFRDICAARASDPEPRGCLAINSLTELGGSHDTLGPFLCRLIQESAARIEDLLREAQARGELPKDDDIQSKARAVQTLMIGLNAFSISERDEKTLWLTAKVTLEGLGLYREA